MAPRCRLLRACVRALFMWMPAAHAQLIGRQESRLGTLEFEANGYLADVTVARLREEIDYQRAVQAAEPTIPKIIYILAEPRLEERGI